VYALELLGSACGVIGLIVLGGVSVQAVYVLYALGAIGILLTLKAAWRWVIFAGLISIIWLLVFPTANLWSNTLWYRQMARLPDGTTTLFTGYSPYQKVDVLETPTGARYLFLDGLEHFGGSDGTRLNVAMGDIPASLIEPANALVVGAGSMQMAALIADHAGLVTTVEIDPMVVAASEQYFDAFNRMSTLTNRRVVIDDAKHYVANSSETYDLVAMDIPAAYSLQTATLYSAPFYGAIAQHLNPDGILVANLTSTFSPNSLTSRRIAASLLANFKEVMVYTPASAGWSFALASNHLTVDRDRLATALQASGEAQFAIYETSAVRAIVGNAAPITLDSMDIVLQTSARWIADRWRGGS
jgi:spermidine synthase